VPGIPSKAVIKVEARHRLANNLFPVEAVFFFTVDRARKESFEFFEVQLLLALLLSTCLGQLSRVLLGAEHQVLDIAELELLDSFPRSLRE